MMNPRQRTTAVAALATVLAGWDVAWFVGSGSAGVEITGAAPVVERQASTLAPALAADAAHADAPQATATASAAGDRADVAKTAEAVTATAAGPNETPAMPEARAADASQKPPPEAPAAPVATASAPVGVGSAGVETTAATPSPDRSASPVTADAEHADAAQPTAIGNAAIDPAEAAKTTEVVTGTTTEKTASADESQSFKLASLPDASQRLAPEAPAVPAATATMPDMSPATARGDAGSTEIVDECLVLEICIDRYLWGLYQRTPKEDTIKVQEQRQVTVKRKGKTRTVTQTFTRQVDEDFGWKDPKAAEKVSMPMPDYVIGGMDQGFKLKLFYTLHAAEEAGLLPGITSAFRDDYRQSLASGLKAATDRSYHGGSFRGGYGHGLAADVVSVKGGTRDERWASSEVLWKWIDDHGKELGIGRPYLDRDPAHVAPIDGKEYADHHHGTKTQHAGLAAKKRNRLAVRDDHGAAKRRAARSSKERTI